MNSFFTLLLTYVLGGLTFIPLLILFVLVHAYLTFPHRPSPQLESPPPLRDDTIRDSSDDGNNIASDPDALAKKFSGSQEKDVAEGYFAVCREYVPGGINGKPPQRTTPAGEVIAEESPSVYQSMYRSLFDKKQAPTLEPDKSNGKNTTKRARNVFYVVLRHGHLMLYDDSEQVEVRHVISLAHHDVGVYGGGNEIPEGELWIKRNAICLTRKGKPSNITSPTKPFYFFSENCSAKEDFYFALLQNQERDGSETSLPPLVQHFETKHVISLVQRLHSSEEQLQTRWINALIGRAFLGIYRTRAVENLVRMKITKKISRVQKPSFLSGIILQKIDLGESAPFVTNPRLRDLTVVGDCCVEADVRYEGNFRIEISATARIDLGARFKAREVNLVLAVVLKKLEGHVLLRFKPPPSNRVWVSFETMPHLEMSIEPIVSSRQITYGIILRAIESRIREVLAETIVLPHWDDSPFLSTIGQDFRGGIWVDDRREADPPPSTEVPDEMPEDEAETKAPIPSSPNLPPIIIDDRSASTPALVEPSRAGFFSRRGHKVSHSLTENETGASSGVQKHPEPPRAIRSQSFAIASSPTISADLSNIDAEKMDSKSKPTDAASFMTEISNRSQPSSPAVEGHAGSVISKPTSLIGRNKSGSVSSASSTHQKSSDELGTSQATITKPGTLGGRSTPPSPIGTSSRTNTQDSASSQQTRLRSLAKTLAPSEIRQQNIMSAANAAKNWGWNTLSRKSKTNGASNAERTGTPEHPIGRGRPLPPPGQPLPPPDKKGMMNSFGIPKRKSLPPPLLPDRPAADTKILGAPTTPNSRRNSHLPSTDGSTGTGLLVVEAPLDSEPSSPITDEDDGYGDFIQNPGEDNATADENEETIADQMTPHAPDQAIGEDDGAEGIARPPTSGSMSDSYPDDDHGPASWNAAEEAEARSKSVWMEEPEYA